MKMESVIALLLAILFLAIIFQNSQVVTLKILFLKLSMSQIILMILFTLVGCIAGFFASKKRW